ncbi:hypothetical protein Ocin01_09112 [Orchesella cincta]|uniref:F-box domain-containing protein n=1 Tax=Orchesella cincta TaxID=48709 RepID=A0A1D2MWX9_ORCCI|nr:hypothetical protein Ocin01_09112 [Orchesella cincta]
MLKDLKLDKTLSFFSSYARANRKTVYYYCTTTTIPTNVGPVENGVKKSTEKSKAQPESSNATPIYRARKSCTKGAAEDLKKRRERNGFTGTSHSSRSRESKNSNVTPSCSTAGNSARVDQSDSDVGGLLSDSESSRLVTPRRSQKNLLETLDDDFPSSTPKKAKIDCKKILQYLNPLEQLSLRRVCKATNKWVTRDQKEISPFEEEKWRNYQLTITGVGLKTFKTATKMGLPITRYTFDVEGEYFYLDEFMDNFLIQFGLLVKDLTLLQFFMFQNQNEYKMFQSLHNLEKLALNNLIENDASTSAAPNPCPSTLRDLQVLKLNYKINVPQDNVLIRPKSWDLTWSMLHDCQSLLYFRFPKIEFPIGMTLGRVGIFAPLMDYIEMRVRLGKVSIEYLDLKHFTDSDSLYINRYMELLRKCHRKDIKLKNVNAQVVQQVFDEDEGLNDKKLEFCENIVSLINYRPFVENAPLRNLEKLIIDVVPSSAEYETLGRDYKNIFWPNLRTIKIKDTFQQRTVDIQNGWQIIQEDLYGLNASGLDRTSVKCIVIDSPRFPYFLSEGRLAQKFYNVTKLKLSSWCRDDKMSTLNKRLVAIWKKLKLVELHIENCPKLNDNSFIEEIEDEEDEDDYFEQPPPAFLKLAPTLKKFTLDLDETRLTDRCFIDVFSQMKLQAFVLLSKQPVDISERALLKLLNGEFGKHIERFPFDGWSTSRISSDRFMRLGRKFRSMF